LSQMNAWHIALVGLERIVTMSLLVVYLYTWSNPIDYWQCILGPRYDALESPIMSSWLRFQQLSYFGLWPKSLVKICWFVLHLTHVLPSAVGVVGWCAYASIGAIDVI
jgi:hypothetical protein